MQLNRLFSARFFVVAALILLAAFYRVVPYEPSLAGMIPYGWNFTPVGAMALFAGACLPSRFFALLLPLGVLLLGDVFIMSKLGLPLLYDGIWINYLAFALYVLIGFCLRGRRTIVPIGCATLLGSIQFFIVSNFGVWLTGTLYPHTMQGLMDCYQAAIPFFRGTITGDAIFAVVLFGGFALAERTIPALREPAPQPLAA